MALPKRATRFHDEDTVLVGNALGLTIDTGQAYNVFFVQSPSANGDTFTSSVYLRAGTYTLSVLGETGLGDAIMDWYVDGVLVVAGQDWYSASQVKNVVKTASVVVATDGYHIVKGVINGHNASSSSYRVELTKFYFVPAGGD